jgi:hypothetical protein
MWILPAGDAPAFPSATFVAPWPIAPRGAGRCGVPSPTISSSRRESRSGMSSAPGVTCTHPQARQRGRAQPRGHPLAESVYIAFVAVLGLAGVAVAHGLYQPWGARIGRLRLRRTALLGGLVLLVGVVIGVGRWIAAGSLEGDGAAGIVITAYFLLGGALFTALGSRRSG